MCGRINISKTKCLWMINSLVTQNDAALVTERI